MIPFAATPIGKAVFSIPRFFRGKDPEDIVMGGIIFMLCGMLASILLILFVGIVGAMFGVGFMVEEAVTVCEVCGQAHAGKIE